MKRIKKVEINSSEFELINNDPHCLRHLYRLNDHHQYSIVLLDRPNRVFSFESELVTAILNDLGGGVDDVTLLEFKEPERGDEDVAGFEIRLHREDTLMSINHRDEVRSWDAADYNGYIEDGSAVSVCDVWQCDDSYKFLRVTAGLRDKIKPFVAEASASEIVRRVWRDCQTAIHSNDTEPGCALLVNTEFGDLHMTRYPDRTVLRDASQSLA